MTNVPRLARWASGICILVAIVVVGGKEAVDIYTERSVIGAASDIGIELTAKDTRFQIINSKNEDGYRGPDVKMFDVTMRIRGSSAVLRAPEVDLMFGRSERERDLSATISVEIWKPTIQIDDLAQLSARLREFQASAVDARAGQPVVSFALREGSVVAHGAAGQGSEVRLKFQHIFGDVGTLASDPTNDRADRGFYAVSGDLTWSKGGVTEGPIDLELDVYRRDETSGLKLYCETVQRVGWRDGSLSTFSAEPLYGAKTTTRGSVLCPYSIEFIRSLVPAAVEL